ncbi:DoxX family membrane protein [Xanthomonas sp. XNM01]|uniref:DoxX family protein n=1 Tax=Xanthomonas sp. XNM01 TaxID=2769289 RepID=UPI00177D5733|nr:DoxX family membrane protein [Xanthomonas sp. XNM01]MBD9370073.1 DoxX family membrane protein [Xanthomonas sp. XNM01]
MAGASRIDAALLVLRVAAGGFLLPHGLGKLLGWFGGPGLGGFAAELEHFGLPSAAPLPLLLALVQTLAGLAVLLGAWTRMSALLAAGFIGVTVLLNLGNGWFWMHGGIEYPVLWLATLLALALGGGGAYAVDAARTRA